MNLSRLHHLGMKRKSRFFFFTFIWRTNVGRKKIKKLLIYTSLSNILHLTRSRVCLCLQSLTALGQNLWGPDGRSGSCAVSGLWACFSVACCQHSNNSRRLQILLSFPGLLTTCMAYALGALDADLLASICVCAVRFNQNGICWCLMWVIVPYSTRLCVCVFAQAKTNVSAHRRGMFGQMRFLTVCTHSDYYWCIILPHMLSTPWTAFFFFFFFPATMSSCYEHIPSVTACWPVSNYVPK